MGKFIGELLGSLLGTLAQAIFGRSEPVIESHSESPPRPLTEDEKKHVQKDKDLLRDYLRNGHE